jgi:hypothetical protein
VLSADDPLKGEGSHPRELTTLAPLQGSLRNADEEAGGTKHFVWLFVLCFPFLGGFTRSPESQPVANQHQALTIGQVLRALMICLISE